MENVHRHFLHQCVRRHVPINPVAISFEDIRKALSAGEAVIILISTYRLDGKKAPHWVLVTGIDDDCLFVHDPDFDPKHQTPMDNQSVPIALNDFDRMSAFGGQRVRAALTIATGEFNPD